MSRREKDDGNAPDIHTTGAYRRSMPPGSTTGTGNAAVSLRWILIIQEAQ